MHPVTAATDPPPHPPEYDHAGDPPTPAHAHPLPAGVVRAAPLPVVAYQPARRGQPPPDVYFPSKVRDLYLPAAILLLGIGAGLAGLIYLFDNHVYGAFAFGSAYAVVKLLMLFVCIPLLTRVAGVSFGTLPPAVLKLCAIAILPEAAALLLLIAAGPCLGIVIGVPLALIGTAVLFALLFELETSEAAFCAAVYWGIGLAFGVGWLTILHFLLGLV